MKNKFSFKNNTIRFIIFSIFLLSCLMFGKVFEVDFQSYKLFLSKFPIAISGVLFIFLYVTITFFAWLAKDIFKIIGAILFGPYISTLLIWISELFNIVILFHFSRILGRDFVKSKLKGRLANFDKKLEGSNLWGLFTLRTVPLVPFRILDLAAGLTKIPFKKYFVVSLVASPPRIFWIQFILAAIGESIIESKNIMDLIPALTDYLSNNTIVFTWSLLYLIGAIVVLIGLRPKSNA